MPHFELIAYTPPGLPDPSIAVAASRAGGLGVLDLTYTRDKRSALAAVAKLAQRNGRRYGIKLGWHTEAFVAAVASDLPEQVETVVLAPTDKESLYLQIQALRTRNLAIWLEVTSLDEARLGEQLGVSGLIAKGQEAGGRVGMDTTFVLMQRLLAHTSLPILAQGGIGLHTAAACYAAGAVGAILDVQLALTRESPLPASVRASIARMDGSETILLGEQLGKPYRVYRRPGSPPISALQQLADSLSERLPAGNDRWSAWREAIEERVGWDSPERQIWPLGQDAAFAAPLAERFQTVGGVFEGVREAISTHIRAARTLKPLDEASPLARSHGTRYSIVQGPMTRVSDTAAFAAKVAEGGGLPFLALALMRAPEVDALLTETHQTLGDRPWGVGILGFVPLELRQEQLEVVRAHRPSYALIAGGRPDQALSLEHAGIPTYLHVPSPGLLKLFIENGARRFVFEGRECGGHVGPRSSFVLWNVMIDALLESMPATDLADCHVLFAGGIHDAVSASMVASASSPLAERGVKVGVLLGTAYLFTEEAVATGTIVQDYQLAAIRCTDTTLLESGPGHATRCLDTPYAEVFEREKRRLFAERKSAEDIRAALEDLNVGRLRIASKGINRHPRYQQDPQAPKFMTVSPEEQWLQGMYMMGQIAALRTSTCTIEELHHQVAVEGSQRLTTLTDPILLNNMARRSEEPCDAAIIGMACLLPKASDLQSYWENILNKVDAITEVPEDRFDWRRYFDSDPNAPDKIYSKWGGFLEDVPFDPIRYGMPPNSIPSIEPLQLLTLEVVRAALADAGYEDRPFPRERTSVILGVGGGVADLGQKYALRSGLPSVLDDASPEILSRLPEWTEDSFPGILLNVAAGRVANRFNLGGVNYTVDAACASSLAAVHLAARELATGTSDMVIVGGADTVQNPFGYMAFSKTHALSPRGRCRAFDETADGIVISEGIAVLILKRLADAERDGDRIYAVIKAVAGSSDGRDKGLTAPRPEGQALALERAYAQAGFSPATVELIEAHGTGTVAGDQAEVETLNRVFGAAGTARHSCALGSVKSMIGHTKCTAGVAGLIKATLALHYKVLPPTLHVEKPNLKARSPESPLYVNTEPRPWVGSAAGHPRRAGVSAFGFGGTNFHAVLEEYTENHQEAGRAVSQQWPSELLIWTANTRQELFASVEQLKRALERGAKPMLRDLAYTLWKCSRRGGDLTLAIMATGREDLQENLARALEMLAAPGNASTHNPRGIYFTEHPLGREGKLAFLFPGQGSQYPYMLSELSLHFCELRQSLELADRILADRLPERLSSYVFPPNAFSSEEQRAQREALTRTEIAQPALGAVSIGAFRLLESLGLRPDFVAGHSYGEYVALCSAGAIDEETLFALSEARGRCIVEAASGQDLGTMAAVAEGWERVRDLLKPIEAVWVANINTPLQTVISGTRQGVEQAIEHLGKHGIQARPIPVACAFHSPVIAPARDRLATILSDIEFGIPQFQVFSNTTTAPYPDDPNAIVHLLAKHLVEPVRFAEEVEAMYRAGARVFIEVGPRNVLTGLVQQTLNDRPHLAVACDVSDGSGIVQLHHALGALAAHGVSLDLDRLFEGRGGRQLDLAALEDETRDTPLSPTTWMINGGHAKPLYETEDTSTRPIQASGHTVGRVPTLPTTVAEQAATLRPATSASNIPAQHMSPATSSLARSDSGFSRAQGHVDAGGDAGTVMMQFQRLMSHFLETQQSVMQSYLRGSESGGPTKEILTTSDALPAPSPEAGILVLPIGPPPSRAVPPIGDGTHPASSMDQSSQLLQHDDRAAPVEPSLREDVVIPVGEQQVTAKLLEIVSERTGYPPEMLNLEFDIEADLGINSIKRVEIVGALQKAYLPHDKQQSQAAMEQLTGVRTLGNMVVWLLRALQLDQQGEGPTPHEECESESPDRPSVDGTHTGADAARFLLSAVEVPYDRQPLQLSADAVFLITDDERGVARAIAEALRRDGGRAVIVRMSPENVQAGQEEYIADLTDDGTVARLLATIHEQHGPLAGIIHLLPLRARVPFDELDLAGWRRHLHQEVTSLFCLAKSAALDLKRASNVGATWLVAATAMGGTFASDDPELTDFSPSQGGVAGIIKTLALEWPHVHCKVVDLDEGGAPQELAERLLVEIAARDGEVEVGYKGSHRVALRPRLALPSEARATQLAIDSNWVLLVTGGARGITAEVAIELALRYRPTIILAGRTPPPELEEPPETAGITSQQALKAALIDRMRRTEQTVTPAQVEAAYLGLLRDREILRNLDAMQRAGARVHYCQVDVRDEIAFANLIEGIYDSHGRIDGVIHGAGIIEDKLVEDKTTDSFQRVFETKAVSAFVLSRALRADSLRFLVLFSSVAGRFGNRGQVDYAAGNEVLNKLAIYLDHRWPGRVVSINWCPWEQVGMASAEVQRQLRERGMQLVSPPIGRRALVRELRYGCKGEIEVVIGEGPWADTVAWTNAGPMQAIAGATATAPLPNGLTLSTGSILINPADL